MAGNEHCLEPLALVVEGWRFVSRLKLPDTEEVPVNEYCGTDPTPLSYSFMPKPISKAFRSTPLRLNVFASEPKCHRYQRRTFGDFDIYKRCPGL